MPESQKEKTSPNAFTVLSGTLSSKHDAQELTFYFDEDEPGKPVKIGDGTFGAVFRIHNSAGAKYALKLLYQTDEEVVEERFRFEATWAEEVRRAHRDEVPNIVMNSLIDPVGWTKDFHETPAFKYYSKEKAFDQLGLNLSPYGLVMDLYEGTLKDLLERAPDSDSRSKLTGYEILESLDFKSRFAVIKPFLDSICEALLILHKTDMCHLDIKPANIYFRSTPGGRFDIALGDLGFVGQPKLEKTASPTSAGHELALGTRHYRSPEQKDFFDVCEVDVEVSNDSKHQTYTLVVHDPKFADTIIEPGDWVVFSKDAGSPLRYTIEEIDTSIDSSARIKVQGSRPVRTDKRTQVLMYKKQRTRTDIFGFGALVFDMITCGRSAERFYDNLRADDAPEKSVEEVLEKYRQVAAFNARDPNYVSIFAPFRHAKNQEYVDPEIVELILRCLLYQSRNTFYAEHVAKVKNGATRLEWKAIDAVRERLDSLEEKYKSVDAKNPLLTGDIRSEVPARTSGMRQELSEVHSLTPHQLRQRTSRGILRIGQLIRMVEWRISRNNDKFFFADMTPDNINFSESDPDRADLTIQVYQNFDEFRDDVRDDVLFTKVFFSPSNPFSLDFIGHLRRLIQIRPDSTDEEAAEKEKPKRWVYTFLDSSPLGDDVAPGDWIVMPKSQLHQVTDVHEGNRLSLTAVDEATSDSHTDDCVFYKNLDVTQYYLTSIGVYIYQMFFVGIAGNSISENGLLTALRAQLREEPSLLPVLHAKLCERFMAPVDSDDRPFGDRIVDLYCRVAALYLGLSLPRAKGLLRQLTKSELSTDTETLDRSRDLGDAMLSLNTVWSNIVDAASGLAEIERPLLESAVRLSILKELEDPELEESSVIGKLALGDCISQVLGGDWNLLGEQGGNGKRGKGGVFKYIFGS